MTKQRVSINGITRWKEVDATPKKAAPAVEEAKVVPLRQAIGEVLRDIRQRQGRTLREVSQRARVSLGKSTLEARMTPPSDRALPH